MEALPRGTSGPWWNESALANLEPANSSLYRALAWRPKPCALEHGNVPHDGLDPRQDPRRPSGRKPPKDPLMAAPVEQR